jgi:hypothetical protein
MYVTSTLLIRGSPLDVLITEARLRTAALPFVHSVVVACGWWFAVSRLSPVTTSIACNILCTKLT